MFGFLLFSMLIIAWAAFNWYLELQPWMRNRHKPIQARFPVLQPFYSITSMCINIYRLFTHGKYLTIDIGITISLTSVFGFGNGVEGGVLGIFMSNCLSVLILITMYKDAKKKKLELKPIGQL